MSERQKVNAEGISRKALSKKFVIMLTNALRPKLDEIMSSVNRRL